MSEKRELSEAEIAQRREAGRKGGQASKTMTEAALEQRRAAAQLSTGPRTEEGKARSSRNGWKTGEYSMIAKADMWQRLALGAAKPCLSSCEQHPCTLVDEGQTGPGGDCLDKRVFVEAFESIISTLQSGDATHSHGMLAAQMSGAIEILQKLRDEVAKAPITYLPLQDKEGKHIGDKPMVNPVLSSYITLLDKLGINLPELMATPRAVLQAKRDEEQGDAVAELFGRLATVAGGMRKPRVIEGERE